MEHSALTLSQSEWRVMESLWYGPKTLMELVRDLERSAGWAKSTVTTMVRRMEEKGLISYDQQGRTRSSGQRSAGMLSLPAETDSLLQRAYHGSVGLLVDTLAQREALTQADIDELYAILRKAEEGAK